MLRNDEREEIDKMTELQKVSAETMRFMRGKYRLDEYAGKHYDIDCLKFRQGKKTIVSINIHEDRFDFQIIFGKAEREVFDTRRDEFPKIIQNLYDEAHTHYDGKWVLIPVKDLETLEAVKKLILIKKRPNRKPFPKEQAVYSDCGHRCDLCVHYNGGTISDEFRNELKTRLIRVYAGGVGEGSYWDENMQLCNGCAKGGFDNTHTCDQKLCAASKNLTKCTDCDDYPCDKSTAGIKPEIKHKSISADDVTWTILPYVENQYGN